MEQPVPNGTTTAAVEAVRRGFQPIPIPAGVKRPSLTAWTRVSWDPDELDQVEAKFTHWSTEQGMTNIGLLLGENGGNLIDVDLDHPKTVRLKDFFLPHTPMRSGRAGRPNSHYWYIAEGDTIPGTRRYKMADRTTVSVELRSTLAQTVIPPSVHPTGESYMWSGEPWGGRSGPARVNGRKLAVQVALLGLGAVLIDRWPEQGSRHEAYLALAGGMLRYGQGVHPFWEKNLPALIGALAEATNDEDGAEARISEVMGTTIRRLQGGQEAIGFGRLAEILGDDHVRQARVQVTEIEHLAGVAQREESVEFQDVEAIAQEAEEDAQTRPSEERDPLGERVATWQPVDLEPYLAGELTVPMPEVMMRDDGQGLMYQGRVNMLYGSSETAKSWLALYTGMQEMAQGNRVMFIDFEDEPVSTLERLRALGASPDDVRVQFTYIRPEEPLEPMQRNRWGQVNVTDTGRLNFSLFNRAIEQTDPSLIIADGMTVLYGLHGLDSNDAVSTDVITGWLKQLTRNGRTTVIIIDHTSKGAEKGSTPIGSQHKVAMVQGTLLQVWPVVQPVKGAKGEIELVVLKDRPGEVRRISERSGTKAQVAARVVMDSTQEGHTSISIEPPPETPQDPAVLELERSKAASDSERARQEEEAVKWAFGGEHGKELSLADLMEVTGWDRKTTQKVLDRMMNQNWLTDNGKKTRGKRYIFQIGLSGYDSDS